MYCRSICIYIYIYICVCSKQNAKFASSSLSLTFAAANPEEIPVVLIIIGFHERDRLLKLIYNH